MIMSTTAYNQLLEHRSNFIQTVLVRLTPHYLSTHIVYSLFPLRRLRTDVFGTLVMAQGAKTSAKCGATMESSADSMREVERSTHSGKGRTSPSQLAIPTTASVTFESESGVSFNEDAISERCAGSSEISQPSMGSNSVVASSSRTP